MSVWEHRPIFGRAEHLWRPGVNDLAAAKLPGTTSWKWPMLEHSSPCTLGLSKISPPSQGSDRESRQATSGPSSSENMEIVLRPDRDLFLPRALPVCRSRNAAQRPAMETSAKLSNCGVGETGDGLITCIPVASTGLWESSLLATGARTSRRVDPTTESPPQWNPGTTPPFQTSPTSTQHNSSTSGQNST
jgi:hypothetical protein